MKLTQQVDNAVVADRLFNEGRDIKEIVYTNLHHRTNEIDSTADLLEQLAESVRGNGGSERLAKRLVSWSNELDSIVSEMRAEFKLNARKPDWT
jgi:predicted CopG family antitoxin